MSKSRSYEKPRTSKTARWLKKHPRVLNQTDYGGWTSRQRRRRMIEWARDADD